MKKYELNDNVILSMLEELANTLGVEVRYEQLKKESTFYPGGLCRVKGESIIIINSKISIEDKIQTMIKSMKSFDLSEVFVKPALRELLSLD